MSSDDRKFLRHINMYLDLVELPEGRSVVCGECDEHICEVDGSYDDWRNHVPSHVEALSDKMDEYGVWVKARDVEPGATNYDGEIVHREYYCPGCATLLHAQPTLETEERPTEVDPEFITNPNSI